MINMLTLGRSNRSNRAAGRGEGLLNLWLSDGGTYRHGVAAGVCNFRPRAFWGKHCCRIVRGHEK